MQQTYSLRDLRDFPCLAYFVTVASTAHVSFRLLGKRADGDHQYFQLSYQNSDPSLRLYQGNLLTLSEPLTLIVDYPDNLPGQFQLTTDGISSRDGKQLLDYTLSIDFDEADFSEIVFSLTGWKKLGAYDR